MRDQWPGRFDAAVRDAVVHDAGFQAEAVHRGGGGDGPAVAIEVQLDDGSCAVALAFGQERVGQCEAAACSLYAGTHARGGVDAGAQRSRDAVVELVRNCPAIRQSCQSVKSGPCIREVVGVAVVASGSPGRI